MKLLPRRLLVVTLPLFAVLAAACADETKGSALPQADPGRSVERAEVIVETVTPFPASTPLKAPGGAGATPIVCKGTPTPTAARSQTQALVTTTPAPTETPSLRLAPPRGVRPGGSHTPVPLVNDAALQARLLQVLGADEALYAVYVKDLSTGRGAAINADQVFYAASVFKLTVMYEVFNQIEQGLLRLEDELLLTPYYASFGLGPTATSVCQELTVRQALQAMMSVSDNAAAILLQDLTGSGNINASMAALGLRSTRLLSEDLPSTASDIALLLDAIGRRKAVSADASETMLELLVTERFDNGVRAGLPADVLVAHKTGNWSNATHDVAIVYAPSATYVLVVLSDRDHETRMIKAISTAVYEHFAGRGR